MTEPDSPAAPLADAHRTTAQAFRPAMATRQHPSGPGAPWQVANVRLVLDSPWLPVDLADITKPSGQGEEHYMVSLPPAAVVVVLDEPGDHVLDHPGLVGGSADLAAPVRAERVESTASRPTEQDEGVFNWIPLSQVPALIASGKVTNSGSLIGLLHVLANRTTST